MSRYIVCLPPESARQESQQAQRMFRLRPLQPEYTNLK
jgi:hypothetical protein